MKLDEMYPSKFMKAEEFDEGEVKIFTIRNIELEELGKGEKKEVKPIVTFREEGAKALVLNKTNAAVIAKFYGDDTDDWLGKKIALHAIEVESFGDVVRAIRVKTKAPVVAPKPAPVALPNEEEDPIFPDDVPTPVSGRGVQIPSKRQAQPA